MTTVDIIQLQKSIQQTTSQYSDIYDATVYEILNKSAKLPKDTCSTILSFISIEDRSKFIYNEFNPFIHDKLYGVFEFILLIINNIIHYIIYWFIFPTNIVKAVYITTVVIESIFILYWYINGYFRKDKWTKTHDIYVHQYSTFYHHLYITINITHMSKTVLLLIFNRNWVCNLIFFVSYFIVMIYQVFVSYLNRRNKLYVSTFMYTFITLLFILSYSIVYNNVIYFLSSSFIFYASLCIAGYCYYNHHIKHSISTAIHSIQNISLLFLSMQLLHSNNIKLSVSISLIVFSILYLLLILIFKAFIPFRYLQKILFFGEHFDEDDCDIKLEQVSECIIFTPVLIILLYFIFNYNEYTVSLYICAIIWVIRGIMSLIAVLISKETNMSKQLLCTFIIKILVHLCVIIFVFFGIFYLITNKHTSSISIICIILGCFGYFLLFFVMLYINWTDFEPHHSGFINLPVGLQHVVDNGPLVGLCTCLSIISIIVGSCLMAIYDNSIERLGIILVSAGSIFCGCVCSVGCYIVCAACNC